MSFAKFWPFCAGLKVLNLDFSSNNRPVTHMCPFGELTRINGHSGEKCWNPFPHCSYFLPRNINENVVCKISAMLFRPRCAKLCEIALAVNSRLSGNSGECQIVDNLPPVRQLSRPNTITIVVAILTSVELNCAKKTSLKRRHNGRDSVPNHKPHDYLLRRLFRRRSKKTSKLRVTGLCAGNSPVNSLHKWPVTRKMFPFDDVIMKELYLS